MRRYLTHNNRRYFAALILLQTLQTAATVGIALLLNYLIDEVSSAISTGETGGLLRCAEVCCCFAVMIGVVVFLTEKIKAVNIRRIMTHVRRDMMAGIFRKRIPEFQQSNTAEYTTILNQNMSTFEESYLKNTMAIYESIVSIVFSAMALIYINPAVAVISIAAMSIPSLIPRLFGKALGSRQEQVMQDTAAYNGAVRDSLNGFEVIQTFGITDVMENRHLQAASDMERSKSQLSGTMAVLYGVSNMASVAVQFLIMVLSGVFAVRGMITIGSIVAVTQLSGQVIGPAFELSAKFGQLKAVKPVCTQMQELMEARTRTEVGAAPKEMRNTLTMRDVTFSYGGEPTIEKASMTLQAGKKYAIVGRSGSGKSTILKLLAGYYSDYSGEISVDGQVHIPCDISLIAQDVFLFDDTIRNNITLFGDYSQEAIEQAVRMAGLEAVVAELEDGLETRVEENGARFSGGERQRIAIARALLHHKSVLLLDEATSALDNENGQKIEQSILDLKNVTCIAVTHKMTPGLLQQYDQIVVMEKGRLVEQGTYEVLMAHEGVFRQLYAAGNA